MGRFETRSRSALRGPSVDCRNKYGNDDKYMN